jgi:hypothetical protein
MNNLIVFTDVTLSSWDFYVTKRYFSCSVKYSFSAQFYFKTNKNYPIFMKATEWILSRLKELKLMGLVRKKNKLQL